MKHLALSAVTMGVLAFSGLSNPAAASTIFTLDQDACTGTCGTAPFGTVSLDQTTAKLVTVTLTLAADERFAGAGTGDALEFNVLGSGVTFGSITPSFGIGPAPDTASAFGTFLQSITCTTCKGGKDTNPVGPVSFTVTSASGVTISDFGANSKGYYFAADIVGNNGNTGNVGAFGAVPEPASVALIGSGLLGVALLRRRRSVQVR